MFRYSKKGFTIVELVIVIAIIAILAAILIPTFSGVIEQARIASDTQVVRNLNLALRADMPNEKHPTMHDALQAAKDFGYDVSRIVAKDRNNILWDSVNDRFVLVKDLGDGTFEFLYPAQTEGGYAGIFKQTAYAGSDEDETGKIDNSNAYQFFRVYTNRADVPAVQKQTFSIYAGIGNWASEASFAVNNVGFDAGDAQGIKKVECTSDKEVIVRTNSYESEIIATTTGDGVVNHHDIVGAVAVNNGEYVEFGSVPFAEISKGRIALEAGAEVTKLHFDANTAKEFEQIIVAADPSVTLPEFSRDEANIKDTGTLVVELQKDTKNDENTDSEYVWLFKQGVISQIVVTENEVEGIQKSDDGKFYGYTSTESKKEEVALGVAEKAKETQKAAVEIANNYTGSHGTTQTVGGKENVNVAELDENGDIKDEDKTAAVEKTGLTEEQKAEKKEEVVSEKLFTLPETITVGDGEILALDYKDGLVWEIADNSIVTMSGTQLIANGVGTTTISANGKTCEVTVTMFHGGEGSEESPYIIYNAKQMQNITLTSWNYYAYAAYYGDPGFTKMNWDDACDFADQMVSSYNVYFKVSDEISVIDCSAIGVNWTPIYIDGSFDGNDVSFVNLNNNLFDNVFQYIDGSYIKNFNVINCNISRTGMTGIIGTLDSYCRSELSNINITGYIEGSYAGGFIGYYCANQEEASSLLFENCTSSATVVATGGIANGMIANSYYGYNPTHIYLNNSYFYGSLSATGSTNYFSLDNSQYQWHLDKNSLEHASITFNDGKKVTPVMKDGKPTVGQYRWGEEGDGVVVCSGTEENIKYSKSSRLTVNESTTEYNLGDKISVTAASNSVRAIATLTISPNDQNETGSYTGQYMSEELTLENGSFTTNKIEMCAICINDCDNIDMDEKYYDQSTHTFHIHREFYGHTHNGATIKIVEYNSVGAVTAITNIVVENATK